MNKFDCRAFSLFETVTRGSQIKTLAIEPNCWDRSTFLNKHHIPSSNLKGCFSGNPGKSPDCRAFINSRFTFNTRDHLTGAKTLYCFHYDLCFIMIILFYPQSAFYPWPAVCSLHFTLSLHFTPGLQSAVCVLHRPLIKLQENSGALSNFTFIHVQVNRTGALF